MKIKHDDELKRKEQEKLEIYEKLREGEKMREQLEKEKEDIKIEAERLIQLKVEEERKAKM